MLLERVLRFNSSLRHVVNTDYISERLKMEKAQAVVIRMKQENVPADEEGIQKLAQAIENRITAGKVPFLGVVAELKRKNSKHLPQVERLGDILECKVGYAKFENVPDIESRWADEEGIDYEWRVSVLGLCSGDPFTSEYLTK